MATELKDRIKVGLDESRMIVLVVQVLIGFECRAAFEPRFAELPFAAQILKVVSFGLLIVALAMLLAVPAYLRIAEEGENTPTGERVIKRLLTCALLPFAAALGMDLAIAAVSVLGPMSGWIIGLATTAIALFFWYGIAQMRRAPNSRAKENMKEQNKPTPLEKKIEQLLTECRIVLPGTQAFLGFQLSAFLTDAFARLTRTDQILHLTALALVALSGILLMTPPAYHRIAENGQMTAHFHRLASRLLLAAMVPLALGISLDFYIVLGKVTTEPVVAISCGVLALATFIGFWFVFPMLRRNGKGTSKVHEISHARAA